MLRNWVIRSKHKKFIVWLIQADILTLCVAIQLIAQFWILESLRGKVGVVPGALITALIIATSGVVTGNIVAKCVVNIGKYFR